MNWKKYLKPKFLNDKETHALYGTIIYLLLSIVNPLFAIIATFSIAVIIELYDYFSKKGNPEIKDIIYTVAIPLTIFLTKLF
jgi:carbon starvation protein CstA